MSPDLGEPCVAFAGVPGAFAEDAALELFGARVRTLPVRRLEDALDAVVHERATHAVVPVENTLAGAVPSSLELVAERPVEIVGETIARIRHVLIAKPGTVLAGVRRVLSHPVALAQCEGFFREHPELEPVASYNTAGAVCEVMNSAKHDCAAIASRRAAEIHHGCILAESLEDDPRNLTRFLLVGRPHARSSSATKTKTTLVLTLPHRPGALASALASFANRGIDLTRIESRPLRGRPFEYAFFLDVEGDRSSEPMRATLSELATLAQSMRVLGSYDASGRIEC